MPSLLENADERHGPAATQPLGLKSLAVRTYVVLSVMGAVLVAGLCAVAQRIGSQFYADDYLYLQLAQVGSLTPSWLAVNSYGHFAPITRGAYLLAQRLTGLDYHAALVLPSTYTALLFLALSWLFAELMGRTAVALALAFLGATSVPLLRTVMWWGAAMHVIGGALTMTLCTAAFVGHTRRGRPLLRWVSAGALGLGLLMQERPLLTIGYLVLMRYLFRFGIPASHRLGTQILRDGAFWFPWLGVIIAYITYRIGFFPGSPQPGGAGEGVTFIKVGFVHSWAPTLVGGQASPTVTLAVILGLVTGAVAIGLGFWLRQGAWRVVTYFAATYLANMAIVAAGRGAVANASASALDLQYFVDVHICSLTALAIGLGVLPRRRRHEVPRRRLVTTRSVAVLGVLVLVISTVSTWRQMIDANAQSSAHAYLGTAQSELHRESGRYQLVGTKLPHLVAPSFIDPYSDVTAVFGLDRDVAPHLDPVATRRLGILADGSVATMHPSTLATVQVDKGNTTATSGTVTYEGGHPCLSGPAGATLSIALPRAVDSSDLYFAATYTSDDSAGLLAASQSKGVVTYSWRDTPFPAGKHTTLGRLEAPALERLFLVARTTVDNLCLRSVWIGHLAAETNGVCSTITVYAAPLARSEDCGESWPG